MARSEKFLAEAQRNQSKNDQRFDSIEQSQKWLEKTLGDLVWDVQHREKGKFPATIVGSTSRVLAVEVSFDAPSVVKTLLTTWTGNQSTSVAQVEAPQVTTPREVVKVPEVVEKTTPSFVSPVEEASAKLAVLEVSSVARVT